jgi:hypothetical protein
MRSDSFSVSYTLSVFSSSFFSCATRISISSRDPASAMSVVVFAEMVACRRQKRSAAVRGASEVQAFAGAKTHLHLSSCDPPPAVGGIVFAEMLRGCGAVP